MRLLKQLVRLVRTHFWFVVACASAATAFIVTQLNHSMAASWLLASVSIVILIPLITQMVRRIQEGHFGVHVLAIIAVGVAVWLQQDWTAIVLVIVLTGSQIVEQLARSWAQRELMTLLKRAPTIAHIIHKNKESDVAASVVEPHQVISIRRGEIVPVDAVITEGDSTFNESSLTGNAQPVGRGVGETILSGSINGDSTVTARVLHSAADSQYHQVVRLVRGVVSHPAPFIRLADRYTAVYMVIAFTIGGVAWILSHQPIRFLDVLAVATPWPLAVAPGIAFIAGGNRALREGVIIKTGRTLEQLAEAKTFVFTKMGILTTGAPAVDTVTTFRPYKRQDVLAYAAALGQSSHQALASAVVAAAQKQGLRLPKVKHVQLAAGHGLEAHSRGEDILVGQLNLLQERGVTIPATADTDTKQPTLYVAVNSQLAGYVTFQDPARQEAAATLAILRQSGVSHTVVVSADSPSASRAFAHQLGIHEVVAEASSSDTLQAIGRLAQHPVVAVGDGVSDAGLLMAADIGVAFGVRGNTAASEPADVIIMQANLGLVAKAMTIARRSFRIATEEALIGSILSIGLMIGLAVASFPSVTSAIIQGVFAVLVVTTALRAHAGFSRKRRQRA